MILSVQPTLPTTFRGIPTATDGVKLGNQSCFQHMSEAQVITHMDDPHAGKSFFQVALETFSRGCSYPYLKYTQLQSQGFPESCDLPLAMGKDLTTSWLFGLSLHDSLADVQALESLPWNKRSRWPTRWCSLTRSIFLIFQRRALKKRNKPQVRSRKNMDSLK